jgi:hypothetical protein
MNVDILLIFAIILNLFIGFYFNSFMSWINFFVAGFASYGLLLHWIIKGVQKMDLKDFNERRV